MNKQEYKIIEDFIKSVESLISVTHTYIIHPNEKILRQYMHKVETLLDKTIEVLHNNQPKKS